MVSFYSYLCGFHVRWCTYLECWYYYLLSSVSVSSRVTHVGTLQSGYRGSTPLTYPLSYSPDDRKTVTR